MKGNAGEGAIYIDRQGHERKAILQSESMIGKANLVYWEGDEPDKDSLKYAMNIPHKSNTPNEKNVYTYKPSAEWVDNFL